MKYQVGDRIMLLHSGEEGHIIDFINPGMVMVEVDKVSFPVFLDQIDFPYFRNFSQKKIEKPAEKKQVRIEDLKKEKATAKYLVAEGVWLAFLPVFDKDVFDDDIVEYFRIFLVNQTNDHLLFTYRLTHLGRTDFELKNEVRELSDLYLHDVSLEEMNEAPRFQFDFSLKVPDRKRVAHFEASLKIKARQLFQRIEEMRARQLAHFSYQLFVEWPEKPPEPESDLSGLSRAGFKIHASRRGDPAYDQVQSVVDLHIEKLTDDWKRMSPHAMLDLQLKTFEKHYELSVLHMQPRLVVIHGVGTGKLRDEIHESLRAKREVKSFINQFHPLFGYGATEIYFQYL
jgi:hypothetical protein